MYNHSNQSTSSTGSGRRISTNNPFRSALLQEERAKENSRSNSPNIDDVQYRKWLNQRIDEEQEEARRNDDYFDDDYYDNYYDNDNNSFTEGDESANYTRPRSTSRSASNNSVRRNSTNPFATSYSRNERSNSGTPIHTPSKSTFPRSRHNSNPKTEFIPPPSYDEVVGSKYAKNEYPKDEKTPYNDDINPFPSSTNEEPRRAKTVSSRSHRAAPPPPPPPASTKPQNQNQPSRLNPDSMTNTLTTRIMSDGRVRSKSTGDPLLRSNDEARRHRQHSSSRTDDNDNNNDNSNKPKNYDRSRPHRSHRHEHERDYDKDYERPRRSATHRKKKFVQERSKNLDTIDKLDVTGFFGGGKFHHDGPFDACTPQRNKGSKAAPVAAFPVDGPNNSIKGMAPNNSKEDQYDMVFGIDKSDANDRKYNAGDNSNSELLKKGYTNGTVIKRADSSDISSIVAASNQASLAQVDAGATSKLHGNTTLGLGSSTFMDGAPAYGATQKESDDLTRKKTFLGRMKTIVRK